MGRSLEILYFVRTYSTRCLLFTIFLLHALQSGIERSQFAAIALLFQQIKRILVVAYDSVKVPFCLFYVLFRQYWEHAGPGTVLNLFLCLQPYKRRRCPASI